MGYHCTLILWCLGSSPKELTKPPASLLRCTKHKHRGCIRGYLQPKATCSSQTYLQITWADRYVPALDGGHKNHSQPLSAMSPAKGQSQATKGHQEGLGHPGCLMDFKPMVPASRSGYKAGRAVELPVSWTCTHAHKSTYSGDLGRREKKKKRRNLIL